MKIHLPIKMLNPQNLNFALGLAKIEEEYLLTSKRRIAEGKPEFKDKLRVQRFSTTQVEDRKKKGLCFHCDEKWQPRHNCKPSPKLYIMESLFLNSDSKLTCQIEDLSDPETIKATPEPQISDSLSDAVAEITLYALVGTPTSGTIRLKGKINGHWVIILIDTGSTHNFVDSSVIPILQLPVTSTERFEVKVANREALVTEGSCFAIPTCIQNHLFLLELNILPMGGVKLF